jgi:hypothetical protein
LSLDDQIRVPAPKLRKNLLIMQFSLISAARQLRESR